jgi:hypothetical protein
MRISNAGKCLRFVEGKAISIAECGRQTLGTVVQAFLKSSEVCAFVLHLAHEIGQFSCVSDTRSKRADEQGLGTPLLLLTFEVGNGGWRHGEISLALLCWRCAEKGVPLFLVDDLKEGGAQVFAIYDSLAE